MTTQWVSCHSRICGNPQDFKLLGPYLLWDDVFLL